MCPRATVLAIELVEYLSWCQASYLDRRGLEPAAVGAGRGLTPSKLGHPPWVGGRAASAARECCQLPPGAPASSEAGDGENGIHGSRAAKLGCGEAAPASRALLARARARPRCARRRR